MNDDELLDSVEEVSSHTDMADSLRAIADLNASEPGGKLDRWLVRDFINGMNKIEVIQAIGRVRLQNRLLNALDGLVERRYRAKFFGRDVNSAIEGAIGDIDKVMDAFDRRNDREISRATMIRMGFLRELAASKSKKAALATMLLRRHGPARLRALLEAALERRDVTE